MASSPSLVDAQITAQARLRAAAADGVRQAWGSLPSYDEADVAGWLAIVVPFLLAVQRASVTVTDAYVARVLGRPPLGIDPLPVIDGVRGGARIPEVYRRPFVTVWSDLAAREPYEQAVQAGLERAVVTAETDVQLTHFRALQAIQDDDPVILGWSRKADPDACAFCRLVDGAKVFRADAAPLHPRCGCSLVPRLEATEPTPLPTGVAVHDHGEYGPTLSDPAHDHLTEAEALARQ